MEILQTKLSIYSCRSLKNCDDRNSTIVSNRLGHVLICLQSTTHVFILVVLPVLTSQIRYGYFTISITIHSWPGKTRFASRRTILCHDLFPFINSISIRYAYVAVVLCFVLVILLYYKSPLVSRDGFTHILQDYFTSTGAILRLPRCQWSNPEKYG